MTSGQINYEAFHRAANVNFPPFHLLDARQQDNWNAGADAVLEAHQEETKAVREED